MKDNSKMIPIIVFTVTFIIVILLFFVFNDSKKAKYSCYDYKTDTTYTFKTEEEMHEVCDQFENNEEDQLLDSYTIYNDLLEVDDPDFAFYPYINSDKELSIIIAISNCDNPDSAKEKAKKWFSNKHYNINDYTIEYEYPCEVN